MALLDFIKVGDKARHILISVGTAVLMFVFTLFVLKVQNKAHDAEMARSERREAKKDALFLELAKVAKYQIVNTYTIKKPKKGSTLNITLDNNIEAEQQQVAGLDNIINKFSEPDSIPARKSLWQRIFGK